MFDVIINAACTHKISDLVSNMNTNFVDVGIFPNIKFALDWFDFFGNAINVRVN